MCSRYSLHYLFMHSLEIKLTTFVILYHYAQLFELQEFKSLNI